MVAVLFGLVLDCVLELVRLYSDVSLDGISGFTTLAVVVVGNSGAAVSGGAGAASAANEVTDATVQAALEGLLGEYVYTGLLVALAIGVGVTIGYLAGRFLGQLQYDTRLSIPSEAEAEAGFRSVERARLESAVEQERLSAVVRDAAQDAATNRLLRGELDVADSLRVASQGINTETRIDVALRLVRSVFETTNVLFVGTCFGVACTAVCGAALLGFGFGRGGNFIITRRCILFSVSSVLSYIATLCVAIVAAVFGVQLDANTVASLTLFAQCGFIGAGVILGVTTAIAVVTILAQFGFDTPTRIQRAQRLEAQARRRGRLY